MNDLYLTLIGLFGTITAISVAYLVLLYEQANKRREVAKATLASEVNSSLFCPKVKTDSNELKAGNETYDNLLDKCRRQSVSSEDAKSLQIVLKKSIDSLRGSDIENVDAATAGNRAKQARHIEKYHYEDTERALEEFEKSETFYQSFPTTSKLAIGGPLLICAYFILFSYYGANVTNSFVMFINIAVAIGGLIFVFCTTTSTLKKLKGD